MLVKQAILEDLNRHIAQSERYVERIRALTDSLQGLPEFESSSAPTVIFIRDNLIHLYAYKMPKDDLALFAQHWGFVCQREVNPRDGDLVYNGVIDNGIALKIESKPHQDCRIEWVKTGERVVEDGRWEVKCEEALV